jgi:hypothetical protein
MEIGEKYLLEFAYLGVRIENRLMEHLISILIDLRVRRKIESSPIPLLKQYIPLMFQY